MLEVLVVDCAGISSEDEFWNAYLETVAPEGRSSFGRNLNAFRDALWGGPGWPGTATIRFVNTTALRTFAGGRFHEALRQIVREESASETSRRILFE